MNGPENKKISNADLDQEVFDLFDEYVHSSLGRRDFIKKLSKYAVAGMTATAIYDYLAPNYVEAIQVAQNDPRLRSEMIDYPSPKGAGKMKGQLSRPSDAQKKLPGIIVVHENRGLNPHIADVGRRASLGGFIALAPDALTPLGGYPGTDDEGKKMQRTRDRGEMLEDFIAAYEHLKAHPECTGKIGVVGFCFGGAIANQMAVRLPDLGASVPFYGGQPKGEQVAQIKAPLLLHYASLDKRVNKGWPDYEATLKKYNIDYTAHMYEGANHGFHNDTTPRYDKAQAELAWKRTMAFFEKHLR